MYTYMCVYIYMCIKSIYLYRYRTLSLPILLTLFHELFTFHMFRAAFRAPENVIPLQALRFKLKSWKTTRPGLVLLLEVSESRPCRHTSFQRCCYSSALQD